jgi:hypothetical protein
MAVQTQQQTEPQQRQVNPTVAAVLIAMAGGLTPLLALPAIQRVFGFVGKGIIAKRGRQAVELAVRIIASMPDQRMEGIGIAQNRMVQLNEMRKAAYLINAVARIRDGLDHGIPEDELYATEQRYFAQHMRASAQRMVAANVIDGLSWKFGDTLGWYAQHDRRTTAECLAADGNNFSVLHPPLIGYPGEVHVNCRCRPGRPHRRGRMLASAS